MTAIAASGTLKLSLSGLDIALIAIYFIFVLGIGFALRRAVTVLDWTSSCPGGPCRPGSPA